MPWNYYARFAMNGSQSHAFFPRRALLFVALAVVIVSCTAYLFLHAGIWLVREDPLEQAQFVVVLSGGLPERSLAAADIYRSSSAKEVWLTRPLQPGAAMQQLHLPYAGEEEYDRMVLIARGVPPGSIRVLQPQINDTADELLAVLDELQSQPGATVAVVTSKAHTRRVRAIWRVLSRGTSRSRLLVRGAPRDPFDAAHWWRASNDALSVVREYLGLLNAWAGLPLHHAT